ncbi:MAG TPA: hypothetical protein VKN35_08310 [Xanthomonadales bacterium]|nr:hypothetical protein [Xanthomonadales bacterium]
MRHLLVLFVIQFALLASPSAMARDTLHQISISNVLENPEYAARLEGVSFYFGDQAHPEVTQDHGEFRTNKKTNAFGKTDQFACEWAMLSALIQLHERAQSLGANAVINIRSNYKDNETSSETTFTCGAGALMAGVALIGTIVNID